MNERPILFSAPMVRALLDGSKTQTRRAVTNPHRSDDGNFVLQDYGSGMWPYRSHDGESGCYIDRQKDGDYFSEAPLRCPYGRAGDRLWVRETWGAFRREGGKVHALVKGDATGWPIEYRADGSDMPNGAWRSSIHMPRRASRLLLAITDVRVERLQDISEADALAEGIVRQHDDGFSLADTTHYHAVDPRMSYWSLWEAINGPGSVESNPWVWAVSFKPVAATTSPTPEADHG